MTSDEKEESLRREVIALQVVLSTRDHGRGKRHREAVDQLVSRDPVSSVSIAVRNPASNASRRQILAAAAQKRNLAFGSSAKDIYLRTEYFS